jgi:serine/threonine-protein kinase
MSPEQIIGKDIDHRTDLYSLGCTIYECATGTVPFFKGDLGYHHVHTEPPAPREINPALSKDLERTILRMLSKDPNDRYQNAKEIIEAVTVRERG